SSPCLLLLDDVDDGLGAVPFLRRTQHRRGLAVLTGGPARLGRRVRRQRNGAVPQRVARDTRQRESEAGTTPRLTPRLQPTSVQSCVLVTDRQAQARAPGPSIPRRIGPPETVEHQLGLSGTQTDPVVTHAQRDGMV